MSELDLLSYFHLLDRWDNLPQNFLERLNSALADGRALIDFTDFEKLLSAALLLDVFLQANFTGGNDAEKLNISALGSVDASVDGIDVSRNAKFTEILKFVNDALEPLQLESASLWTARVHVLHQKILTEHSKKVRDTIIENYSKFIDSRLFSQLSEESKLSILIELMQAHLDYREVSKAADLVPDVLALAKMEQKLLGSLGKRTRYQEKLVAQMRVDVQAGGDAGRSLGLATSDMPKNIVLNDESILNEVMYADDLAEVELSSLQYAALWALIRLKQYSTVRDKLLEEEIFPYLNLILRKPNMWALHHGALLARSTWEKSASKKVERALAQVENLVNETRAQQPSGAIRAAFAFEISLSPTWSSEKLLASILSSLGCTREALEVYQRLNDIPNVIECFKSLGRLDRAEQIIRDHLAARKTPQMLTYLGDVTNNPVYYEEAWELSGHRYGMAQKNLGIVYLRREMHAQAMDAFNLAARTLVMSDQPWYNMGYCAMKLEDYPAAAKAFRRCVDIEPDSFDAWNNLAAAYTHMKELDKAFYIIQEALKANFENWKIWDNFLTLSVETRHWDEAIRSLHKLIDLQKSSIDGPLLIVLSERCDESSIEKLRELLARVTSTCASSDAWFAYAVALSRGQMTPVDAEKCTKAHQRSFAMMLQKDPNWNQSMESINSILDRSSLVLERYSVFAKDHGVTSIKQGFSSVRLNINSVLSRLSQMYEGGAMPDMFDSKVARINVLLGELLELVS